MGNWEPNITIAWLKITHLPNYPFTKSSSLSLSRFNAACRICSLPRNVSRGSVAWRHRFIQEPQTDAELSAMVRGVQHAPPEHPDTLPLDIKKRNDLQPPFFIAPGQAGQPWPAQLFITPAKSRRNKLLRNQRRGFRFSGKADEFGKETSL